MFCRWYFSWRIISYVFWGCFYTRYIKENFILSILYLCCDVSVSARSLQVSRWYCNGHKRHFSIYLLENWADLGETWYRAWGKSDPVKFLVRSLHRPFFCEEYHASFWSLPLYGFPRNLAEVCEFCRRASFLAKFWKFFVKGSLLPKNQPYFSSFGQLSGSTTRKRYNAKKCLSRVAHHGHILCRKASVWSSRNISAVL